ncbi:transporter associated domain-containing protein [Phenylobacterium sp.]|uniref:transporter associated domain-containing protein n=1 Tax=Phenylobacterium sp. TaxID=1871053 RepID=UPI0025FFDD5D|nr:transporter associated domain-containing protein [Phenylobacterium sp.]
MTDPDPSSRPSPRRRPGLLGLFDFFRGAAEHAADDMPEQLTESGGELVSHARAFQDLRVEDVMKPRADIVGVERTCSFAEVVARFVEAEHSRMPVYRDTLDEPVGVVHVKDVFKLLARKTRQPKPEDRILAGRHALVREVLYVPPSQTCERLLTTMRAKRIHMALVIDEFGGVDGLVTLEDLLEMLVGEIDDEHDDDGDQAYMPIVADDDGWIVDGRAPLEELESALGEGVDLASADLYEEIDTVAGLMNALAGRVPQKRERIAHADGFLFEVLLADPRRVKRVRVRRAPADARSSAEAE